MPSNVMSAHTNESLASENRPFRHQVLDFKATFIWHNLRLASSAAKQHSSPRGREGSPACIFSTRQQLMDIPGVCGELQPTACRLDAAGVRQELAQMETTLEGECLSWAVVTPTLLFLPSVYVPTNFPKPFLSPFLHLKIYTLFQAIAHPARNWLPGLSYDEV